MSEIKLIAFDLDGTIFNTNKELSKRNYDALKAASEKGIAIVPATGRFYKTVPDSIKGMPFLSYLAVINGASVKRLSDDKIIYKSEIPLDKSLEILDYLDTLGVAYDCYDDNESYIPKDMMDNIEDYIEDKIYLKMVWKYRKSVPDLKTLMKEKGCDIQKLMAYTRNQEIRHMLLDTLGDKFGHISVTSSIINNVEINAEGANKGKALEVIADDLGIKMSQVMAFGDSFNDIPMLKAAGVSVCMGNGNQEVKVLANIIAPSNDEDGVASVLEETVLK